MAVDRAHQCERNDRHHDKRAGPARENPRKRQVNPDKDKGQARLCIVKKRVFLFTQSPQISRHTIAALHIGKDIFVDRQLDL